MIECSFFETTDALTLIARAQEAGLIGDNWTVVETGVEFANISTETDMAIETIGKKVGVVA